MMDFLILTLCAGLGFVLHLTTSWGEQYRTVAPVSLWAYVRQDPPGWLGAVAGSLIAFAGLPVLDSWMTGLPPGVTLANTPLGAAVASYIGSSQAPKWLGMATKRYSER